MKLTFWLKSMKPISGLGRKMNEGDKEGENVRSLLKKKKRKKKKQRAEPSETEREREKEKR